MNKAFFFAALAITFFVTFPQPSTAQNNSEEKEGWSGSAELGVIFTTGNTNSTSAKSRLEISHVAEHWTNEYLLDILFKQDEVTNQETGDQKIEKTAEKYFASAKSIFNLASENSKLFVFTSHTEDKFGGVREITTVATGYGHRLLKTETASLQADIGPGYSVSEQADGEEIEDAILRISTDFRWKISDNAKFSQTFSTEIGADNVRTKIELGLFTKINSSLQMKLGVVTTNNSEVTDDTEQTDTESTVTLVYSFF